MARVLVASPHPSLRAEMAAQILEMGHEALQAGDGQEALTLLEAQQPAVAILDTAIDAPPALLLVDPLRHAPWARQLKIVLAAPELWQGGEAAEPLRAARPDALLALPCRVDTFRSLLSSLLPAEAPVESEGGGNLAELVESLHAGLDQRSYYDLLGVKPDANEARLKAYYLRRSLLLHPDRHRKLRGSPLYAKVEAVYKRINEAYSVLSAPTQRMRYDEGLKRGELRLSETGGRGRGLDPEASIKDHSARKFYRLGRDALAAGNPKAARMHLQLARSREADSAAIAALLEQVNEALGNPTKPAVPAAAAPSPAAPSPAAPSPVAAPPSDPAPAATAASEPSTRPTVAAPARPAAVSPGPTSLILTDGADEDAPDGGAPDLFVDLATTAPAPVAAPVAAPAPAPVAAPVAAPAPAPVAAPVAAPGPLAGAVPAPSRPAPGPLAGAPGAFAPPAGARAPRPAISLSAEVPAAPAATEPSDEAGSPALRRPDPLTAPRSSAAAAAQAADPEARGPIRHLAVVAGGAGDWASERGTSAAEGVRRSVDRFRNLLETCLQREVAYLSFRPLPDASEALPGAFASALVDYLLAEREDFKEDGIRLDVLGRAQGLGPEREQRLEDLMTDLGGGRRLVVQLVLEDPSRAEVVQGLRSLAVAIQTGQLDPAQIDEQALRASMPRSRVPDPDLLLVATSPWVRGGTLSWRSARCLHHYSPRPWPDFDRRSVPALLDELLRRIEG